MQPCQLQTNHAFKHNRQNLRENPQQKVCEFYGVEWEVRSYAVWIQKW